MMAQPLFPPYNPRILGLGVGARSNLYRLFDLSGREHFVKAPNIKAAQAILDRLDKPVRERHRKRRIRR